MTPSNMKHPSLYIHIPFCKKKCSYCDFYSEPGVEYLIPRYLDALLIELKHSIKSWKIKSFSTVFFGGGTPSLLSPEQLQKIINHLNIHQLLNKETEISIETNPGTVNLEKLQRFKEAGINRLSIGVQSFNDLHLKTLGRIHDAQTALDTIENAYIAGFKNVGIDLMFALPNQTLNDFKDDIHQALEQKIKHISLYSLQVEEKTPLWKQISQEHSFQLPSEEEEAEMYEYAIDTLKQAGFHHYEISNFAMPGYECRHNIAYWKCDDYLGLGAGAHSLMQGHRHYNLKNIQKHIKEPTKDLPEDTQLEKEKIFMGLRLLDGAPKSVFDNNKKELALAIKEHLLEEKNDKIRLTHKGLLLGNLVFERFV